MPIRARLFASSIIHHLVQSSHLHPSFTADFATYYPGNKYFEVYSPLISTLYGQVFWTVMDPVPLPAEVVAQFKGKTMAITGYGRS